MDRFPSTPEQLEIGKMLVTELKELGLGDARMSEHGYVFATLPGNLPAGKAPVIGLLAHMDTYPGVSGRNVQPMIHRNYDGKDIVLSDSQVLKISENPDLLNFIGHDIITADGTTLLGADDKAGIAEILEAIERLKAEPARPRPTIRIGFTPDEEVGNGTAHFDLKEFGADFAYTLDGSSAEEVENETFCADTAIVTVTGRDVHPGYAKGKMVSAVNIVAQLIRAIPEGMKPETTEGRQGYLHPTGIEGSVSQAKCTLIIRDFEVSGLKKAEELLSGLADVLMQKNPGAKIEIEIKESYRNMKYDLAKRPEIVDVALAAVERAGKKAKLTSIRGGTDGSRLSAMGLLTPNICGGGKNFHSKQEWIPVSVLEACTQVTTQLVWLWGSKYRD